MTASRILSLLVGCLFVPYFVAAIWIGYLTWIGIVAGLIYLGPNILSTIAGLAGKKRLEFFFFILHITSLILIALILGIAAILPQHDSAGWRQFTFDEELAAIQAQRAVPNPENAAFRYQEAFATVDVNDRPEYVFMRPDFQWQPWKGLDYPRISAWLDSHAKIISELVEIGQMEQCRWPIYSTVYCHWPVPLGLFRYTNDLLVLSAYRHLGEGRLDGALKTCFALLGRARHLRQQTYFLDWLFGFGCEEKALPMLRHVLVNGSLSPEQIDAITRHLPDTKDTWQRDIKRLLEFEEYRFANCLASCYEINERGKIRFSEQFFPALKDSKEDINTKRTSRAYSIYHAMGLPSNPQKIWPIAQAESNKLLRILERGPIIREHEDILGVFDSTFWLIVKTLTNMPRLGATYLCFEAKPYLRFGKSYAKHLTERRGTWLVLGLCKYRNQYGQWPKSLETISEFVPEEALLDPGSGNRFIYIPKGDSFKLYGTGINGIDDGGRFHPAKSLDGEQDDIALWPPRSSRSESKHEDVNDV